MVLPIVPSPEMVMLKMTYGFEVEGIWLNAVRFLYLNRSDTVELEAMLKYLRMGLNKEASARIGDLLRHMIEFGMFTEHEGMISRPGTMSRVDESDRRMRDRKDKKAEPKKDKVSKYYVPDRPQRDPVAHVHLPIEHPAPIEVPEPVPTFGSDCPASVLPGVTCLYEECTVGCDWKERNIIIRDRKKEEENAACSGG